MSKIQDQIRGATADLQKMADVARRARQQLPVASPRSELAAVTQAVSALTQRLPRDSFRARARREGL